MLSRLSNLFVTMSLAQTLRRLPQVVAGLVTIGVGIGLMVQANLGLPPWDVFHQGLAARIGWSFGSVMILVSFIVLLCFVPLREKMGVGTLLNAVLIGLTADATIALVEAPDALWLRWLFMLGAPVLVGLGSGLYIGGGLGPGPRDGVMTGLARRGIQVWKARTGIEVTVLIAGIVLGGSIGVGTLWFTLAIGPLVHFFLPIFALGADGQRRR